MKFKKVIILGAASMGIVLAVASFVVLQRPVEVIAGVPVKMNVENTIRETGTIGFKNAQTIYCEGSGKIAVLGKDTGEHVKKGELLIQLDDYSLQLQLKDADAKIASAKAQLEGVKTGDYANRIEQNQLLILESKRQLALAAERETEMVSLYQNGAISESDMKMAKDQRAMAESGLKNLELIQAQLVEGTPNYQKKISQAQLDQAIAYRDQLIYGINLMKISAPIDGIVLEKWVDKGAYASPGIPLMRIGNPSEIQITVEILSDEIDELTLGDSAVLSANYLDGITIKGKVSKIASVAKETMSSLGISQKRLEVTIEAEAGQYKLVSGMPVDVKIIKATRNSALCLPITSVREDDNGVYVLSIEGGVATRIPVMLGIQSGQWQEVITGLSENTMVINDPVANLAEGQKVKAKSNQ